MLLGAFIARTAVRTWVIAVGSCLAVGSLTLLVRWFAMSMTPLEATETFLAAERVGFVGTVLLGAMLLRALATRKRAWVVVEVLLAVSAVSYVVVEHRHGALNRPFSLADPIISRGGDPTVLFFAIGGAATALALLILIRERNLLRMFLQVALLFAFLGLFVAASGVLKVPEARPVQDGLGLRGTKPNEEKRDKNSQSPTEQLEFKDQYEDPPPNSPPVAVVLFEDDYSPATGMYYFRQNAFSQYNGRRLVSATRKGADEDIATVFPSKPTRVPRPPERSDVRSMLDTTVGLLADHNRPFGLESPVEYRPTRNADERRFRRVYEVSSAVVDGEYQTLLYRNGGDPTWPEQLWFHYTEGPSDPRYAELAAKIVRETLPPELSDDPFAKAYAITDWLGKRGKYSLKSEHASAEDPTADFLFGDLVGYCVHFAHAAAYLMRTVGVPTRVATGYASPESNRQGGSALLLTGADAHAWPEVFIEDVGWVVVDVSVENLMSSPPPPPDPDLQRLLGDMMRDRAPLPTTGPPPEQVASQWLRKVGTWAGRAALIVALTLLLALYAIKGWRRIAPFLIKGDGGARLAYRAALDQLSEVNIRRQSGESQTSFAMRLQREAPNFAELTASHLAQSYGGQVKPGDLTRLKALRRERRALSSMAQRILGGLAPWTWLTSR